MAIIDIVKLDVSSDKFIVNKFASEKQWELRLGSQLIVNQSQEAIFVKGGLALDTFGPGTHTLISGNIPLLDKFLNRVFGDKTPFSAEVWFINKTVKRDLKWGTPKRIPVFDPKFGFPVNVGAFGQWGFRIDDSRSFVSQIVGAQLNADSEKIYDYFIGEIVEKVVQRLATMMGNGVSIVEINSKLTELSGSVISDVKIEFERFGVDLVNFTISNISIAADEMQKIQEVMAKKMEAEQLGAATVSQNYLAIKNIEIIKDAANNEGAAGAIMSGAIGAGLALGVGLPLGQQIAKSASHNDDLNQASGENDDSNVIARLKKLKVLFENELITKEEYETKKATIIDSL